MDRKQMIENMKKLIAVKVAELEEAQSAAGKIRNELHELQDLMAATVRDCIKEAGLS